MKNFMLFLIVMLIGINILAAEKTKTQDNEENATIQMAPEQRKEAAKLHEQIAVCLRSDKPISDCRNEMWNSCGQMMGEKKCQFMNGHMRGMMNSKWMHGQGMYGRGMMNHPSQNCDKK